MMEQILFIARNVVLLLFGVGISALLAGVHKSKIGALKLFMVFIFCTAIQILVYSLFGDEFTEKIYPFIAHAPLIAFLCLLFRLRFATVLASVATTYLLCQPANWIGILVFSITQSDAAESVARIVVLCLVAVLTVMFLGSYISSIYTKDARSVFIFGSIPFVYYLYDYAFTVYTDIMYSNNIVVVEFMPFVLCFTFVLLCGFYYKEYEERSDAERKEQIVRITVEQQAKEIAAVRRSEHEIKLLRHDMRMVMNSIAVCIDNGDFKAAQQIVSRFTSNVDNSSVIRYCNNDILNYILSDFASKCAREGVDFRTDVVITELETDEVQILSVISNALDNALNAQREITHGERYVKLVLKNHNGKLLISVANPYGREPVFINGFPVARKKGHGYGTQSIRYMTERLGGNCQFKLESGEFVLRVII